MTTKLSKNVARETSVDYRGRNLVAELTQQGVVIRPAGTRKDSSSFVPYQAIYELGLKLQANSETSKPVTRVSRGLLKVGG